MIAATLRDHTTRALLLSEVAAFVAPQALVDELARHRPELKRRSGLEADAFDGIQRGLLDRVRLVPRAQIAPWLAVCLAVLPERDAPDATFLACALATGAAAIWAHDTRLARQRLVPVHTNHDLLRLLGD